MKSKMYTHFMFKTYLKKESHQVVKYICLVDELLYNIFYIIYLGKDMKDVLIRKKTTGKVPLIFYP